MKKTIVVLLMMLSTSTVFAQLPLSLDLGLGGGISLPIGTLSNGDNTGFHGGVKARLSGLIPMNVSGSLIYNRLPNKVGGESDIIWVGSAGVEYSIPSVMVEPYLGVDVAYNSFSNTGSGASARSRFGLGFGGGVLFNIPALADFDVSLKYQILNAFGKDSNEDTVSQIAANVSLMFSLI